MKAYHGGMKPLSVLPDKLPPFVLDWDFADCVRSHEVSINTVVW